MDAGGSLAEGCSTGSEAKSCLQADAQGGQFRNTGKRAKVERLQEPSGWGKVNVETEEKQSWGCIEETCRLIGRLVGGVSLLGTSHFRGL